MWNLIMGVSECTTTLIQCSSEPRSGAMALLRVGADRRGPYGDRRRRQAGHSAEPRLGYHAHLFAEFDPARRVSAEEEIRKARAEPCGRSEDAGGMRRRPVIWLCRGEADGRTRTGEP